jgi:SPOR domain
MRWLFLLVLSLNLAYVAWQMSKPSNDYSDVPALKNVEPIVLLSELKQRSAEKTSVVPTEIEQETENSVEVLSDIVAPEAVVAEKEPAATEVKATGPTSVPSQESVAVVASVEAVDPAGAGSEQAASCYTLGPFRDLDNLRALTREIKSYVVKADFRGREEKEQTIYWVYIQPEATRKKAIETGNRLKAKKIKDFYVIRDGEKENGLSLGHFRNKNGAYGLARKVKKLGFDVLVEPVFKTYTVYWLDYQLSSGVAIPESIFEKYIKTAKKDQISRLSRDCGA